MAQRRKSKKKPTQTSSVRDPLGQFVKLGRTNAQAKRYPEAIAAYEAAMDLVRPASYKVRKRHEWLWPALAELYVRVGQINLGRALYREHLVFLLGSGRIGKFRNTIRDSRDVAGADLQIDLVSVFRETKKLGIIHQLSRPTLNELFSQAIEAYESDPDPFTFALISELLSRVDVGFPPSLDSLEARLTQPGGLTQVLEGMRGQVRSPIPVPAALSTIDEDERRRNLHAIWTKRVHGTRMYRGAGYGVRTAIFFLLDMLDDARGIAKIEVEGIEDFDIHYDSRTMSFPSTALPPRAYVQAKSRDLGQPTWSVGQLKDVLNNFAEVHCEDPEANFLFVTDYHFGQQTTLSGILDYPDLGAFDEDHSIRDDVLKVLNPDFIAHERFDVDTFLKCIHFRVLDRDLEYLLIERLADLTGSPKGIAVRYYDALFEEVHKLAETAKAEGTKKAFSKPDLERFLHEVIASVDVSAIERPLRRGNLELMTFSVTDETPPRLDPNYYLGVYAGVRHILANQDILRPELMEELAIKLVQRDFCVLRSPSGTGKTTLMYRFAYNHRHSFAIYRLRHLDGNPETIKECIRYIKSLQPSEHSPVLLLIDDISRPEKRGWQELLKPVLENPCVYVIATTREDEWRDFLARGINVEYAHLSLSEDTARRFHQMLKGQSQLHPDHPDWREAYEASKTDGAALFMEYAHILTRGRRIREVLSEQVKRIAGQPAPDNAIQMNLLRLICTAHAFGGRVPADLLPSLANARGDDLHRHLESLADEHLVVCEQEYYVGLHEVRSRLLRDLTHQYPPPSLRETLTQLLTYLPLRELAPIVEEMCQHLPEVAAEILESLALRLNVDGEITETAGIIRHLYIASEWHYAQKVKEHLDQFGVNPSEVNIFAIELAPVLPAPTGILNIDLFRAEAREAFVTAPSRGSNRFEQQVGSTLDVTALASKIHAEDDTAAIVYLLSWLRQVDPILVEKVVANVDVPHLATMILSETSGQRAASLLFHVWRSNPTAYSQLVAALGGQLVTIDKLLAAYPLIAKIEGDDSDKEGDGVHLYFWAEDPLDELGDEVDVHDKAVFLAGVARRMFPTVARVRTTGLFATGREYKLGAYDPATKDMPVGNFVVLEDVEKNRIWLRAISARYTSKTWYAYLQQQDILRVKYLTSLNLMAALLQTSPGSRSRSTSSVTDLARLVASYQSLLQEECRTLPLPPDPEVAFLSPQGDRDVYRDPDEVMREQLLQGLYYMSPRKDTDGGRYFRNYVGAIDRCVQFLCEYVIYGDMRKVQLLRLNATSAMRELNQFLHERENLQLRQAEHADLSPVELRLVERVQKATQYVFDRDYEDLWPEANTLLKKSHLLIDRLNALQNELDLQRGDPNIELARALSGELATMLPSVDVLVKLSAELQHSPIALTLHRVRAYIRQLSGLMALDCFVALAQKRQEGLKATRLEEIENRLRTEGVQIAFGSPILEEEETIGITWETLPIVFQVSDLKDVEEKGPAIFKHIFAEGFGEWQRFALVVTDGQAIVWPVVWVFSYLDRPRWDLAEQIDPSSFLRLCLPRMDLVEQYSAHLGLPIAEEPEYVQAMQAFYSAVVEASTEIARLRHDIRLQRKDLEEAKRFLESESEGTGEVEDEESHPLQAQIDFLTGFQSPPEFQDYHAVVLNFIVELGDQLKREVDTLKQMVANAQADVEIQTVPDMIVDNLADSIEASSSSQTEEQVRVHLSAPDPVAYEDMDIPSKFGVIYFVVKNYFHFGRTEY